MATNVTTSITPSIQSAGRTQETQRTRLSVTGDGSSSGFAKQTDVQFTNSVNNMSAVLDKIANTQLSADNTLPRELQQLINNVVKNAFSLEDSLGSGVGSALTSERYSVEQLTTLSRIFQQLGNTTEGQPASLSTELQAMVDNLKTVLGNSSTLGSTANLEPVIIDKLAFQLLNDGNSESLPAKLDEVLQQLSSQGQPAAAPADEAVTALKQLIEVLFPKLSSNGQSGNGVANGQAQPAGLSQNAGNPAAGQASAEPVVISAQELAGQQTGGSGQAAQTGGAAGQGQPQNLQQPAGQPLQQNMAGQKVQPNTAGQAAQPQMAGQAAQQLNPEQNGNGANPTLQTSQAGEPVVAQPQAAQANSQGQNPGQAAATANGQQTGSAGNGTVTNQAGQTLGTAQQSGSESQHAAPQQTSPQQMAQAINTNVMRQAAEVENNPLFKQIFSRYGYTQETGLTRPVVQTTTQQAAPQLANNAGTVNAFKDMAQLLLKDSTLSAKDAALLQDFVNGNQSALNQQDVKQLSMLLRLVQNNIPAAVQQAGQQQGMDGLPKLWAFLQLTELSTLKDLKQQDYKNANRQIKTMVNSMRGSMTSEGSYKADGQKSISFVMPLYIGENEQSYPTYVHIYDEPPHEDEKGVMRKDTWFRVCVLTENIGAVDVVCQLFEGNNLNLRVKFSDQEAVQSFSEFLPDIRKALYDTSIHLNDLKVGTVNA